MKRRRKDIGDRDRENKKRECVRNQENYKNYGNRDEGEGFSDVWPQVSQFLDRVEEQIEYRPVRESIRREMGDHIEDRMQDYISGGCGREEAAKKAVAGMGDPEVIGRQLNDIRRPRKDYALPAVVLLCVAAGLLVSFLSGFRDLNFFSQNVYFLFGIAVLFFFVRKGCFFAARYAKAVSVLYFSAFLLLILLTRLLHWRYTPAIYNGNFLLPVAALLLIGAAESKRKAAAAAIGFTAAAIVCQILSGYLYFTFSGVLILLMSMAVAGILLWNTDRKVILSAAGKRLAAVLAVLLILIIAAAAVFSSAYVQREEVFRTFFSPEESTESVMDDSYNALLIRSLLKRASWIGEVKLSGEDLERYSTGEWYFGRRGGTESGTAHNGYPENGIPHNAYDAESTALEDILPYQYQNNYVISYLILRCGRIAGILVMAVIVSFFAILARRIAGIRSRSGFVLSVVCFCLLAGQAVFYILGNFGWQLGAFCNLPFLSEGLASIFVNAILTGIIASAYRYDSVRNIFCERKN